jgi:tryptophan-rich sensory protein
MSPIPTRLRQTVGLAAWLGFSFLAAASSLLGSPGEWYSGLNKPSWNPPGWVFVPAWSLLYSLMGTAAWLVWRQGGWQQQGAALRWFVLQWIFNALWTPLFFGLRRPDLAFLEILALIALVSITLFRFWKVSRPAGILLMPYLAWVCFAAFLNLTLWRLNP